MVHPMQYRVRRQARSLAGLGYTGEEVASQAQTTDPTVTTGASTTDPTVTTTTQGSGGPAPATNGSSAVETTVQTQPPAEEGFVMPSTIFGIESKYVVMGGIGLLLLLALKPRR